MNRSIFSFLFILGCFLSYSQLAEENYYSPFVFAKLPTDTIIPGASFSPTLFRINATLGYVAGTNGYGDVAKA